MRLGSQRESNLFSQQGEESDVQQRMDSPGNSTPERRLLKRLDVFGKNSTRVESPTQPTLWDQVNRNSPSHIPAPVSARTSTYLNQRWMPLLLTPTTTRWVYRSPILARVSDRDLPAVIQVLSPPEFW